MRMVHQNTDKVIEWTDNGEAYVNPYNGCNAGCPFCYWLNIPDWEGKIEIRSSLPDQLEGLLTNWDTAIPIYMGSYCDPYNDLEEEYEVTRHCLERIVKYQIPLILCTSARNQTICRDISLFQRMSKVTIVTELCRLDQMEAMKNGREHQGIVISNQLAAAGIRVWSTLAPILPKITKVEEFLDRLDPSIPLYIDRLYMEPGSIQEQRLLAYVKEAYPDCLDLYIEMIQKQDTSYYQELLAWSRTQPRLFELPFPER